MHPLLAQTSSLRYLALVLAAALVACGSDGDSTPQERDATGDPGGGSDTDQDVDEDVTTPQPEGPFYVSFSRQSRLPANTPGMPGEIELVVLSSDCSYNGCSETVRKVGGGDFSCRSHFCALSEDLAWVVYADPNNVGSLRAAQVNAELQLTGNGQPIASDMVSFQFKGGVVAWRTSDNRIRWHRVADGASGDLGGINQGGDVRETGGGYHLATDGRRVVVYSTSLSTMRVTLHNLQSGSSTPVYRFISGSATSAGSFYSGDEATVLSDDGEWLAIATTAIVLRNACSGGCAEGLRCIEDAEPARCGAEQTMIHLIHLPNANLLGQGCSRDDDCGTGHFCDTSYISQQTQQGTCMPGRTIVGPGAGAGCSRHQAGEFTSILPHLGWIPGGRVAAMAVDTCTTRNQSQRVSPSALLSVDVASRSASTVFSVTGTELLGPECLDASFNYRPERCNVNFTSLSLSPTGTAAVLVGQSVGSSSSDAVWVADLIGGAPRRQLENRADPGEADAWFVRNVRAHPR